MARQDRGSVTVRLSTTIELFVVAVFVVGCSYEPDHIRFDSYISPEQYASQIKNFELKLNKNPDDLATLTQFGALLSHKYQNDLSIEGQSSVANRSLFFRIDSIADVCSAKNYYDKIFVEYHIRNILYYTNFAGLRSLQYFGGSYWRADYLEIEKLRALAENLLLNERDSQTAHLGLLYYYIATYDEERSSKEVHHLFNDPCLPIELQWNWFRGSGPIGNTYLLKSGTHSRKMFLQFRPTVSPAAFSGTIISGLYKIMYHTYDILNTNPRFDIAPNFVKVALSMSVTPIMGAQYSAFTKADLDEYWVQPLIQIGSEYPSVRKKTEGAVVQGSISIGDYESAMHWLNQLSIPKNNFVIEDDEFPWLGGEREPFFKYLNGQPSKTIWIEMLLHQTRDRHLRPSTSEIEEWLRLNDSLKQKGGNRQGFVSVYEIDMLTTLNRRRRHSDTSLFNDTWDKIKLRYEYSHLWRGTRFIIDMVSAKKFHNVENCLREIADEFSENRDEIFLEICRNASEYFSWVDNEPTPYCPELYGIMTRIGFGNLENKKIAEYEIAMHADDGGPKDFSSAIDKLQSIRKTVNALDYKRISRYYNALYHLYSETGQWSKALGITLESDRREIESNPDVKLREAFCYHMLGMEKVADSVFQYLENRNNRYPYQYHARAFILAKSNRLDEADMILSKVMKNESRRKEYLASLSETNELGLFFMW